jgi:hypothetical protein
MYSPFVAKSDDPLRDERVLKPLRGDKKGPQASPGQRILKTVRGTKRFSIPDRNLSGSDAVGPSGQKLSQVPGIARASATIVHVILNYSGLPSETLDPNLIHEPGITNPGIEVDEKSEPVCSGGRFHFI